ncbi:MAG: DUF2240 family protein [Methanomassiliicoccales archaeon]
MNESELPKSVIATIFRRKGKTILTEKEFIYTISMELRWCKPAAAKTLLEDWKRLDFLKRTAAGLTPAFSLDDATLKQLTALPEELTAEEDVVSRIVKLLSIKLGLPKSEILAKINKLKKEKNIETQAAAVELALQSRLQVSDLAELALQELSTSKI